MNSGDAFTYWVNNTDFRLFPKEEPPEPPTWCEWSLPLVEWGDSLLYRLSNDPDPRKIAFAKWKLLDRYWRLYFRTERDHRAETNLDNHLCLHQALLAVWEKLEDMELARAIPELEPPEWDGAPAGGTGRTPPGGTRAAIVDGELEHEGTEYNGIVIGQRMR